MGGAIALLHNLEIAKLYRLAPVLLAHTAKKEVDLRSPSLTSVAIFVATGALFVAFALSEWNSSNSNNSKWCDNNTCYQRIPSGLRVTTGRDTYLIREIRMSRNGLPEDEAQQLLQKVSSYLFSFADGQPSKNADEVSSQAEAFLSSQMPSDKWNELNKERRVEITFYGLVDYGMRKQ